MGGEQYLKWPIAGSSVDVSAGEGIHLSQMTTKKGRQPNAARVHQQGGGADDGQQQRPLTDRRRALFRRKAHHRGKG